MAKVELKNVTKRYGDSTVVNSVSLFVRDGEFLTLLGPSGCGKTTCLRMVAGFVEPDDGAVTIGGEDVTQIPPYRRNTGMVFQQYALFPHLTVGQNLAFGLRIRKLRDAEVRNRVHEALQLVRLGEFAKRYPSQLSGGQKQRVALARAIVINPRVLLLDEPLGALDQKLREELQGEIKRIQKEVGITTIFVTHDQNEALSLSDRVAVMHKGEISQIGSPQELYDRPINRHVASFVGKINMIDVRIIEIDGENIARVKPATADEEWHISVDHNFSARTRRQAVLALRPERIQLGGELPNRTIGKVVGATYVGDSWLIEVESEAGHVFLVKTTYRAVVSLNETVTLSWNVGDGSLLPEEGHLT